MDRSTVITLVKQAYTQNEYGVQIPTETRREVYAQVDSVTANEFFEGGRNGLNPEFRFTMFGADYEGERVVEYQGGAFAIYRTYIGRGDNVELYAERKGGTNGGS